MITNVNRTLYWQVSGGVANKEQLQRRPLICVVAYLKLFVRMNFRNQSLCRRQRRIYPNRSSRTVRRWVDQSMVLVARQVVDVLSVFAEKSFARRRVTAGTPEPYTGKRSIHVADRSPKPLYINRQSTLSNQSIQRTSNARVRSQS